MRNRAMSAPISAMMASAVVCLTPGMVTSSSRCRRKGASQARSRRDLLNGRGQFVDATYCADLRDLLFVGFTNKYAPEAARCIATKDRLCSAWIDAIEHAGTPAR